MRTTIGVFQGKQAKYNKFILETLYFNEPLTTWELTKKARAKNRYSLHAIFNRRLRSLEKKGYVQKVGKKWVLQFKGIIAVLLSQSKPKPWNEKWNQILENYIKSVKDIPRLTIAVNGKEIADLTEYLKNLVKKLRNFEDWVLLANKLKEKMDRGFINFDIIKNETLFALLMVEFLGGSNES